MEEKDIKEGQIYEIVNDSNYVFVERIEQSSISYYVYRTNTNEWYDNISIYTEGLSNFATCIAKPNSTHLFFSQVPIWVPKKSFFDWVKVEV